MSRLYFIQDKQGTRQLDDRAMPLVVGSAEEARIKVKGLPADLIVAYIAEADGHPYLQPAQTQQAIFHNHRRISESTWLKSGDWIQVGDTALNWQVAGDHVYIHVLAAHEQPMPQPPSAQAEPLSPEPASLTAQQPILQKNHATTPTTGQRLVRRSVTGALIALALLALFIVFATPITIRFMPESAEYSLSGFPPAIPFAGRLMVLPGQYSVQAEHDGYRDFTRAFTVNSGELQGFYFAMQELPGQLAVQVAPDVLFKLYVDEVETNINAQGIAALERGQRRLRIESEGYLAAEQVIDVEGFGQVQKIAMLLQPAWATVMIDSQPQGALVRVDEHELGKTPLQAEVAQGQRTFAISLDGYKPLTVEKTLIAGNDEHITNLKLVPADGKLDLNSEPEGATITVNGRFYATTPTSLILASNKTHKLRLSKPGYKTTAKDIKLAAAATQTLTLKMAQEYGSVFVRSQPADARLMVDGKDVGKATQRLRLSTQPHTLIIQKSGFTPEKITITPRAGVSQTLNIALKTFTETKREQTPSQFTTTAGQTLRLLRPTAPFKMGASRREPGRRANESPRLVQLTRPFYLAVKEVTNAEFRLFRARHNSGASEGALLNVDSHPVVNISWDDAAQYCNWLSKKEGLPAAYELKKGTIQVIRPLTTGYRLPSEAEWAYVARIHEQAKPARYPWVGTYPPKTVVGNFADAQISNTLLDTVPGYDDRYRATAPVGSFPARPNDFYDLGGNVSEWTNDYYAVYPGKSDKLLKDPLGPETGEHHVVKGSSWRQGNITELRLSYRDYSRVARDDVGFRIARYAE